MANCWPFGGSSIDLSSPVTKTSKGLVGRRPIRSSRIRRCALVIAGDPRQYRRRTSCYRRSFDSNGRHCQGNVAEPWFGSFGPRSLTPDYWSDGERGYRPKISGGIEHRIGLVDAQLISDLRSVIHHRRPGRDSMPTAERRTGLVRRSGWRVFAATVDVVWAGNRSSRSTAGA